LGARILSLVDYFDGLTTEGPNHKAVTYEQAVELIGHESGSAFDPHLVAKFVAMLPSVMQEVAAGELDRKGATVAARSAGAAAPGLTPNAPQNAFENIALAHREISALYEIAQAMSTSLGVADTMALISSKLTKIVPWSGCSLFMF